MVASTATLLIQMLRGDQVEIIVYMSAAIYRNYMDKLDLKVVWRLFVWGSV